MSTTFVSDRWFPFRVVAEERDDGSGRRRLRLWFEWFASVGLGGGKPFAEGLRERGASPEFWSSTPPRRRRDELVTEQAWTMFARVEVDVIAPVGKGPYDTWYDDDKYTLVHEATGLVLAEMAVRTLEVHLDRCVAAMGGDAGRACSEVAHWLATPTPSLTIDFGR